MARYLVDEDLPRSLARVLRDAGFESVDVRDIGLRGKSDDAIFEHGVSGGYILLTGDLGFGNLLRFPLGSHPGIFVVRFPNETPTSVLNQAVLSALRDVPDRDSAGSLVVVEPGRLRLRKKT